MMQIVSHVIASMVGAIFFCLLVELIHQPSPLYLVVLTSAIFLLLLCCFTPTYRKTTGRDVSLLLDQENPQLNPSPYRLIEDDRCYPDWQEVFQRWPARLWRQQVKSLSTQWLRTALLAIVCGGLFWYTDFSETTIGNLGSYFDPQITLTVLGASEQRYQLSAKEPPTIELANNHLIRIEVIAPSLSGKLPTLKLTGDGGFSQAIQLQQLDDGSYVSSLRIAKSSTVRIPEVHQDMLAKVIVATSGEPQVSLALGQQIADPHPDEQEILLRINADAQAPLTEIKIQITTSHGVSEELVHNIIADDRLQFAGVHRLLLEPYLQGDVVEVELVAVASDRLQRIGFSEALQITTISAYGRYRQVLTKLRAVKERLDQQLTSKKSNGNELRQMLTEAVALADNSPFFDVLDRLTMTEMLTNHTTKDLPALSDKLNAFLLEHEAIDDRQRDRDFFVATRRLAQMFSEGQANADDFKQAIADFLDERRQRWRRRVGILPPAEQPATWSEIADQQPFKQQIEKAQNHEELAQVVERYKRWLTELEEQEDNFRQQLQEKTQQLVAEAQNTLQELQKRQGQISRYLDKAQQRYDELPLGWGMTRLQQNSNIKQGWQLADQLRQISAVAAARLQGAVTAMRETLTHGDNQQFVDAESSSDLASRLLRDSRNATRQQLNNRGRRRRLSGDRYYGQALSGTVQLPRGYRVNDKYRQQVLEDINNSKLRQHHRQLLDNYLRRIIR